MSVLEAPVFYPTPQEWLENDPITYIEKVVRPHAEKAGICKIVPPKKWHPQFSIENTKFQFATRVQHLNLLQGTARIRQTFEHKIRKYCFVNGKPLLKAREDYRPDFYLLFKEVVKRGGHDVVTLRNEWSLVQSGVKSNEAFADLSPEELKMFYFNCLGEFEATVFKPDPDLLLGRGKRIRKSNQNDTKRIAMDGLLMGSRGTEAGIRASRMGEEALQSANILLLSARKQPPPGKKRTPRKNTNDEIKFPDIGKGKALEVDLEMFSTLPRRPKVGDFLWKWFEDEKACFFGTIKSSFKADNKKVLYFKVQYQSSNNKHMFERNEEESELALAIACGATPEEAKEAFLHGVCQVCNRAHAVDSMLSCDECEWRFHEECLLEDDRTNGSRDVDWFCPLCLDKVKNLPKNGEDEMDEEELTALRDNIPLSPVAKAIGLKELADFGFPDGEKFSLEEYKEQDVHFRAEYEKRLARKIFHSEAEIEAEFWRITKGTYLNRIAVNYGNDLDTAALGSGFPTKERLEKTIRREKMGANEKHDYEYYANSTWNLNNLPLSRGSLLQHVEANISGVIVPWLYMGMTFSAFCFHVEDHNFASINYHHLGAPKSWWGVPATGADQFEKVANELCPELFEARPDLLQGIVTQFDPNEMTARGVPMFHLIQRPGDFVVTFPRAYHGGFNHGFNSAEAVNFAGRGWLGYGAQAIQRYASLRKTPVVAHEALLISIAAWCLNDHSLEATRTCVKLLRPFVEMVEEEKCKRLTVAFNCGKHNIQIAWKTPSDVVAVVEAKASKVKRSQGSRERTYQKTVTVMGRVQTLASVFDGVPRCVVCKRYCPLSHSLSPSPANKPHCLEHSNHNFTFVENNDLVTLNQFCEKVLERAVDAENWMERANRLCQGKKQPDDALGLELSGGQPFSMRLNKLDALPCEDYTFSKISDWKVKPSLQSAMKLLALKSAEVCEDSSVWKRAVDQCQAFIPKLEVMKLDSPDAFWNLNDIEQVYSMAQNLPLTLPDQVISKLVNKYNAAMSWRDRVRQGLNQVDNTELFKSLDNEMNTSLRVAMPEWSLLSEQKKILNWISSCRQNANSLENCLELNREFESLNYTGAKLPKEKSDLDALISLVLSYEKAILELLSEPISVQKTHSLVSRILQETSILPRNFFHLQALDQCLNEWVAKVSVLKDISTCKMSFQELIMLKAQSLSFRLSPDDPDYMYLNSFLEKIESMLIDVGICFEQEVRTFEQLQNFLGLKRFCFCRQIETGDMVNCENCKEWYHVECVNFIGNADIPYFCSKCEKSSAKFCYCRSISHENDTRSSVQCRVCLGRFHADCAEVEEDIERFTCFTCVKSKEKYLGKNLDPKRKASKCSICSVFFLGPNAAEHLQCAACEDEFHVLCSGGISFDREYLCSVCCERKDEPETIEKGQGFLKKKEEMLRRLRFLSFRPVISDLEAILKQISDVPSSLLSGLNSLNVFMNETISWTENVRQHICKNCHRETCFHQSSNRMLWSLLDESLSLPIAPAHEMVNALYGELQLRFLLECKRTVKTFTEVFLDEKDRISFENLKVKDSCLKENESSAIGNLFQIKSWMDSYQDLSRTQSKRMSERYKTLMKTPLLQID